MCATEEVDCLCGIGRYTIDKVQRIKASFLSYHKLFVRSPIGSFLFSVFGGVPLPRSIEVGGGKLHLDSFACHHTGPQTLTLFLIR